MEETINGVIISIFKPNKNEDVFSTVIDYGFKLKIFKDKRVINCYGKSFELFEGENVKLEGHFVKKVGKNEYFSFKEVKVDLAKVDADEFFYKIFGKETFIQLHEVVNSKAEIIQKLSDKDKKFFCEKLELPETSKRVEKAIKAYAKYKDLYVAYEQLSKYGINLADVQKLIKQKTLEDVVKTIKVNPYRLINDTNFTFNQCDIINARETGNCMLNGRLFAGVVEALREDYSRGNTYTSKEYIISRAKAILNVEGLYQNHIAITENKVNEMLNVLIERKCIVNDSGRYYLAKIFEMEETLRQWCKTILKEEPINIETTKITDYIASYEKLKGFSLGKEQKEAIVNSLQHRISVITGGAGTGKTSSLAVIVKYFLEHGFEEHEIALCAPTGKAGQRMMESINGQLGSCLQASTIHVLLGAKGTNVEEFTYNKEHKLDARVIVVDETSMLDLSIAYSLITAVKNDARIIFLGDIDQLPPVMAGYFLRDLIASNIPCVKLYEIHRQKGDSTIIPLSLSVKNNSLGMTFANPRADYCFVQATKNKETDINWLVNTYIKYYNKRFAEETKDLSVEEIKEKELYIREKVLDEIMVVTPLRDTKDKTRPTMNGQYISNKIQDKLFENYSGKQFSKNGYTFKIGSKVIVSKNNNEKKLTNGQIGYIRQINLEEKTVTIYSDNSYYILDDDDINNLLLAYAITVHKSQGSEWKLVIYCCFDETRMNQRNLVYTAVTRAKKSLIIFGDYKTFANSPTNLGQMKRSRLLND